MLRGGWEVPQRKSLLRNNCDGTFTDVTAASGLAKPATSTQTAAWADINNDGLLDLFVGNEDSASQLFLNKGGSGFEDISRAAGVDRVAFTKGVSAADYDNDGFVDFYVSNFKGDNFLYRNNHDNTFTEMARAAGVPGPGHGFATWFFDYDNDGWSDLFATSYFTSVDESVRTYLGLAHNAASLKLYKNLGDGSFRTSRGRSVSTRCSCPWGRTSGTWTTTAFSTSISAPVTHPTRRCFPTCSCATRKGNHSLTSRLRQAPASCTKGTASRLPISTMTATRKSSRKSAVRRRETVIRCDCSRIPGTDNDWMSLRLVGVKTNRAAIGARIKLTVENEGRGTRSIHRTVGSGGSFGASPLEQHIGLGKSARIVELEIWWPASNTRQRVTGLRKNQAVEITELARSYTAIERRPITLGRNEGGADEALLVADRAACCWRFPPSHGAQRRSIRSPAWC